VAEKSAKWIIHNASGTWIMKKFLQYFIIFLLATSVVACVMDEHGNVDIPKEEAAPINTGKCTLFFDGCNTCRVEDGRITSCTKMYCSEKSEAYCIERGGKKATDKPFAKPCKAVGGKPDSLHSECLEINEKKCRKIGGFWNECASPCRNMPYAKCAMVCVPVCSMYE
jgi:hypothetical protein